MAHLNRIVAALAAIAAGGGCLADEGDRCRVDSDCGAGLVCGFDGVCATFEAVRATFEEEGDVSLDASDTASGGDTVTPDATGCQPVQGVFEASTPPCPDAPEARKVVGLEILEEGGLTKLAPVANLVLADGFSKGDIVLELRIDGSLEAGCEWDLAWVQEEGDIQADCTPVFGDTMPLVIPGLVTTAVKEATLDPNTHVLRGVVDKAALLASMDPSIRATGDQLITADVDTDDDGTPDHASAAIQVLFEGDLPED